MGVTAGESKGQATYRVMLAVVIILGVLIALAFLALVMGGIMKFAGRQAGGCMGACGTAHLPPHSTITGIQTTGNRLIIGLHTSDGDAVEIVDTETGHMVALIDSAPHGLPK
jgi:hypothetical protein